MGVLDWSWVEQVTGRKSRVALVAGWMRACMQYVTMYKFAFPIVLPGSYLRFITRMRWEKGTAAVATRAR